MLPALFLALATTAAPMGWLGAALSEAPPPQDADLSWRGGVLVSQIVEGSPAEKAGLRGRDVILGIDGLETDGPRALIERIKKLPPDSWIGLRILRRGKERQIDVRLGTRPDEGAEFRLVRGWIGVRTIELPPTLRTHFGAPEDAGVMVSEIVEGGPAEAGGMRIGDVIYAVDGEPVAGSGVLFQLVTQSGVGNAVDFSIGRDGAPLTLEVVIDKAPPRPETE